MNSTQICELCGDFNDLDWNSIAKDVFESVKDELDEDESTAPPQVCPPPVIATSREIITGDDTEDDDSDLEEDTEEHMGRRYEEQDSDEEEDPAEVNYYYGMSSQIFSGAHQSRRTKSHLLEDIRKLYTINRLLLTRMAKLQSEKHQLLQQIHSKINSNHQILPL